MTAFAKARIKPGAKCFQDFSFYTWPPSQYEGGRKLAGVDDNTVFVAEKKRMATGKAEWVCRAKGAGVLGNYGNGAITVYDGDLEFLTPMLGYDPSERKGA